MPREWGGNIHTCLPVSFIGESRATLTGRCMGGGLPTETGATEREVPHRKLYPSMGQHHKNCNYGTLWTTCKQLDRSRSLLCSSG